MVKTFIFRGFDGIYTSIFGILSSKYIQLALLEVPILCSSLQERLMAKRSRARGAGSLPEDRFSPFLGVFFGLPCQGKKKTSPTQTRKAGKFGKTFKVPAKERGYGNSRCREGNQPVLVDPHKMIHINFVTFQS